MSANPYGEGSPVPQWEAAITASLPIIFFTGLLLYLFREDIKDKYHLFVSGRARDRMRPREEVLQESMRIARLKQQQYIAEQTQKDAEIRVAKEEAERLAKIQRAEEFQKKQDEERGAFGSDGHASGRRSDDASGNGPMARLPKLPGGEREAYRPTAVENSGNGGHYKPSGPNCRKKRGG